MALLRRKLSALLIAILAMVALGMLLAGGSGATTNATPSTTTVGGLISSDTTWTSGDSPYIVTSSLLVQQAVTLTIEPGVEVRFDLGLALQVNGELVARGTAEAQVVFTSNEAEPAPGDWGFILFTDSSVDAVYDATGDYVSGSILEHCTIEFAGSGSDYALRLDHSSPLINRCTVKGNAGTGISVDRGNVKIVNSTISGNTTSRSGGILIINSNATLSGNIITGNTVSGSFNNVGGGIEIYRSTATLSGNIVIGNTASSDGGGIQCHTVGKHHHRKYSLRQRGRYPHRRWLRDPVGQHHHGEHSVGQRGRYLHRQ